MEPAHYDRFLVVDHSNGAPLSITSTPHEDDTVSSILEHVARLKHSTKSVTPNADILSIEPASAPKFQQANTIAKLRKTRSDWREILEECASWHRNTRLSAIRAQYEDPDDLVYLIVLCDVHEQASLHPIAEEPEGNRQGQLLPNTRDQPSIASIIQAKMKPPSTSAKNDNLIRTEHPGVPEAVYDGRPAELSGPSITIYHPIFAEFKQKLSQPPVIGRMALEDLQMASILLDISAKYFANEGLRQLALQPVIEHFLKGCFRETVFQCGKTTIKPDGHRVAECGLFKKNDPGRSSMLPCIEELKNGIGQGEKDPTEQAGKGYVLVCTAPQLAKLRTASCMPAFLLGISGPYIMISGAVYLDGAVSQRLTDMISLVPDLSSLAPLEGYTSEREKLLYRVAHVFRTLGTCLDTLCQQYLEMSPRDIAFPGENVLVPAPHFTSFHADSRKFTLTYQRRIFDSRSNRAVFLAEAQSGTESVTCIVKFTSRYCKDAHKLMESAGAAPRLLYCAFEPSVGKFCVVMEYIKESAEGFAEAIVQPLQIALAKLHAKSYVFGDLRSANVVIDASRRPYLIDFDWSGVEGTVFYPCDLNMEGIRWAKGVEGGAPIQRQHDEDMLQILIDDLRQA